MKKYFDIIFRKDNRDGEDIANFRGIEKENVINIVLGVNGDNWVWIWSNDTYKSIDFMQSKAEIAKIKDFLDETRITAKDVEMVELRDDGSKTGGISFHGECVYDFLEENGLSPDISLNELNKALRECGIEEI